MVDKADDAIAMWQQMVGEMQKGFRAFGDQLSHGSSDRMAAGSDKARRQMTDLMESYFAGMNLPSRMQLTALSDRLQAIEGELVEIKLLLQKALAPKPVQDAPATPELPPKRPSPPKPRPAPARKRAPAAPKADNKP